MRRLRALFFTLACVVGAVLGTAGATYAESTARCPTQLSRLACEEHLGPTAATPAGSDPETPAQPASVTASSDPSTDPASADAPSAGPDTSSARAGSVIPAYPGAGSGADVPADPNAPAYSAAGSSSGLVTAGGPTGAPAPMRATAVLHVPTPEQPASPGQMDPITDKAVVLLVGWVMLVMLGGGVCVGRRAEP